MYSQKLAKLLIGMSLLISFSSCSSSDDPSATTDKYLSPYDGSSFVIQKPKEWEVIEKKDFSSRVPQNTEVVFRNNIKDSIFTANINIISKNFNDSEKEANKSLKDIAQTVIDAEKTTVFNYQELLRQDIQLKNGDQADDTLLIVFEGKNNAEEPTTRYSQTFMKNDNTLYIITGTYKPTEDEQTVTNIQNSLRSFTLK